MIYGERSLENTVTEPTREEKDTFLDFASCMLRWMLEERKMAKELLGRGFFDSFYEGRMNDWTIVWGTLGLVYPSTGITV